MKKITIPITVLFLVPTLSYAALDGLKGLIRDIHAILNLLFPVIFALALVYFFWGVAQFILNEAGNDKTREDGKKKILWGIIALFILASIYGILSVISNITGIPTTVNSSGGNYPTPTNYFTGE